MKAGTAQKMVLNMLSTATMIQLGKVKGNKIEVKTLPTGTKFITLDEVERELHEEDLMICDDYEPLCIAGVFGGIESGVSENTSSVFLESACFNSVYVRKTASNLRAVREPADVPVSVYV